MESWQAHFWRGCPNSHRQLPFWNYGKKKQKMYFRLVARDRSCKRFLGTNYSEGNPVCELAPEKRPEVADVGELPRATRPVAPGYFPLWVLVGVSQGLGSKQTANNAAIADANRDTAADDKIG
jgi:hypothetical protein